MYLNVKNEKIFYMSAAVENAPMNLFLAGITQPNPNFIVTHNTSSDDEFDRYQFEYVTGGIGYITVDGKTTVVREGDFFFLNKCVSRTLYADRQNPWEKMFITVNGPLVDGLVSAYQMEDALIVIRTDVSQYFRNILSILQDVSVSTDNVLEETAVELLKIIQQVNRNRQTGKEKNTVCRAEHILNYIDRNTYRKFTLDELSDYFFLSKTQIIRIFNQKYKISPMQYACARRIALAQYHLSKSNISITALSEMLAFSDSKHFAKAFKKHVGKTPSEFRKSNFETQKITLETLSRSIGK